MLEPLGAAETEELVAALIPEGSDLVPAVAERSGGNPLFAEEMARRIVEEGAQAGQLPETVQAVLAARLDALEPFERRLVQQAAVVGRTFWEGSLVSLAEAENRDLRRALITLQEKDILAPGAESRLAGERELAFKHVLIRDVAYGMLPKAVRSRKHYEVGTFIEERAGDRTDEVVTLLAEHYGRAADLGLEGGVPDQELIAVRERGAHFLEEAGDAAGRLYSNREAASHYRHAREVGVTGERATLVRIGEKLGDVSLRLGRVDEAIDVWTECLDWHRGQEDLERVADLHRKIGAGLSHKGERKAAIEHYQKGINLLKDGKPRLELVRLYEEAAWLYLHTGDNMLAIYASEKALRLAERLGETRAASRAHGIFGRVFGRIGDTERARQNLERAVELARGSDHTETILALSALGRHLEISEADVRGAREAFEEALALAVEVGVLPAQVELHASLAQLAVYGADWERVERATEASADLAEREGLVGKLCLPYGLKGVLRWREGDLAQASDFFVRSHDLAEQVGWSELTFGALFSLASHLPGRRRPGRGHRGARPGHRRLRAGRPRGAVDPGHRRPGRGPGPPGAARGRSGGGRRRRASSRSSSTTRSVARRRSRPGAWPQRTPPRAPPCWRRPGPRGRLWSGPSRPPRRGCSRASCCSPSIQWRGGSGWRRPPPRPTGWAFLTSPSERGRWRRAERQRYCVLSAPATTTTVASPARPWLAGSIGSRWSMSSRRPTAAASRSFPGENSTTDSARARSVPLAMVPLVKPALSTRSASWAASPWTVVSLSTATVTPAGLIPPPP